MYIIIHLFCTYLSIITTNNNKYQHQTSILSYSSFINNTAPTGGAIYAIDGYTQNANGICNNSIFISNSASEKYGGAIDTSDISIKVNYCSFINNTSLSQGETINYKHYSVGSFNYDYNWWGNNTPFNNGSN